MLNVHYLIYSALFRALYRENENDTVFGCRQLLCSVELPSSYHNQTRRRAVWTTKSTTPAWVSSFPVKVEGELCFNDVSFGSQKWTVAQNVLTFAIPTSHMMLATEFNAEKMKKKRRFTISVALILIYCRFQLWFPRIFWQGYYNEVTNCDSQSLLFWKSHFSHIKDESVNNSSN